MGWFHAWLHRPSRPRRGYRPRLTELEGRIVPAPLPLPPVPAPGPMMPWPGPPDFTGLNVLARNLDDLTVNQAFTTAVAGVRDALPNAAPGSLHATVDWGDKTTPDTNVPLLATP